MKKQKKVWIVLALIIVLIIIVAVVGVIVYQNKSQSENADEFVEVLDDGSKVNTSSKLQETKTLNGLEFSNMSLIVIDDTTTLSATVTNTTDETIDSSEVNLVLLDEDGNTLNIIVAYIATVEPGESTQIGAAISADYSNAYDFRVEESE